MIWVTASPNSTLVVDLVTFSDFPFEAKETDAVDVAMSNCAIAIVADCTLPQPATIWIDDVTVKALPTAVAYEIRILKPRHGLFAATGTELWRGITCIFDRFLHVCGFVSWVAPWAKENPALA